MVSVATRRLVFWLPLAALLVAGVAWLFRPQPVLVDLVTARRGEMRVSVSEDGVTRIRDVFVVSAPVAGIKKRIRHKVGDLVVANETVITSIQPTDPEFLDPRSEMQAQATVKAAEAALEFARADIRRAEAEVEFAESELKRARQLARSGTISESAMDRAENVMRTRVAALEEAQAQFGVKEFELERARAALVPPAAARAESEDCECVDVYSPVDGRILRILSESEGVIPAGAELVEIGDPANLEIVVDLLSADALKVTAGQGAVIRDWGGERPLPGVVRRVEPYGFTKVSALGIEEQRVNVLIDIDAPRELWRRLGHGFRVEAEVIVWTDAAALTVPVTALFREGERWAVLKVEDGVARTQLVEIGARNGVDAEVLGGLREGDRVVLHPGDRVGDGSRVSERANA